MTSIESYMPDIERLCFAHKVKHLFLFGSASTNTMNEHSDVDFIVDFEPIDVNQYADNYYDLKYSLEDLLHKKIDLLEEKAIKNPYFMQVVNQQRRLVYGH